MGTLMGFVLILTPILIIGLLIYLAVRPPDRRAEKDSRALLALSKIYTVTGKYSGGLDPVGQALSDEIQTIVTDYWKESTK